MLQFRINFFSKYVCLTLLLLLSGLALKAQNQSCLQSGVNIAGSCYYCTDHMFSDAYKSSGRFGVSPAQGNTVSPRRQVQFSEIPADSNGYPLQIPYFLPGYGQAIVQSPVIWDNQDTHQPGVYTLLWDGIGSFSFFGGSIVPNTFSQGANSGSAKINVSVTGTFLRIEESQLGNHVRNIRLIRPGFENTYNTTQIFNPTFLDRLRPFYAIRFMGLMKANGNNTVTWEERTKPTSQTQDLDGGVSYEYIIQICNSVKRHAWLNAGYALDDNHIRRMARMFKQNLDPDLHIYLEYGNEMWNFGPGFNTFFYLNTRYNLQPFKGYAIRSSNLWSIFREEFGPDSLRIKRVIGSQSVNTDISNQIIRALPKGVRSFDYLSPAFYIDLGDAGRLQARALGDNITPADINNISRQYWASMTGNQNYVKEHVKLAKSYGKGIVCYEGGQHYVTEAIGSNAQPNVNSTAQNAALWGAKFDNSVKPLYQALMDSLARWDVELAMGFLLTGGANAPTPGGTAATQGSGSGGGWGFLTSIFDPAGPGGRWDEGTNFANGNRPQYQFFLDNIKPNNTCPDAPITDTIASGMSMAFNGSNSYATQNSFVANEQNNYTIEMWAKPEWPGISQYLFSFTKNTISNGNQNGLFLDAQNRLNWQVSDDNGVSLLNLTSARSLPIGTLSKPIWHHISAVKDGQVYSIYLNGVLIASASGTAATTTRNSMVMGARALGNTARTFFRGELDEIRMWNSAISQINIRNWMCRKIRYNHPQRSALRAYFTGDVVSGSSLFNKVGASGTLFNFTFRANATYRKSGAPIGDISTQIYPANWTSTGLSVSAAGGGSIAVENVLGAADGLHIYTVNQAPSQARRPANYTRLGLSHYYGVFLANGNTAQYDVIMNPIGHTNQDAPANHRLVKRANNSDSSWQHGGGIRNLFTQSLELRCRERYRAEYILGVRQNAIANRSGAGGSINFDGNANSRVTVFPLRRESTDFTISCWVKTGIKETNGGAIWELNDIADDRYLRLQVFSGSISLRYNDKSIFIVNGYDVSKDWNYLTVVRKDSILKVYINGVSNEVFDEYPAMNMRLRKSKHEIEFSRFVLGQGNNSQNYKGQIDELSIFNKALSQDIIREYMCKKITKEHPDYCSSLSLYWNFDEPGGTVLEDRFGPNDGVLLAGATMRKSGAPVGDYSGYSYMPNLDVFTPTTTTLTAPSGLHQFSATLDSSSNWWNNRPHSKGIHVYRVENTPEISVLPNTILSQDSSQYWGVYVATTYGDPKAIRSYTSQYRYTGNPVVNPNAVSSLRLLNRRSDSIAVWQDTPLATLNAAAGTLTMTTRPNSEQYLLAGTTDTSLINDRRKPDAPDSVVGPRVVCMGSQNIKYYLLRPSARAKAYRWQLPTGLSGYSVSDTILVNVTGLTGGPIKVSAANAFGESLVYQTKNITINPSIAMSGVFSAGPLDACRGTLLTYTIAPIAGISSYIWTVPDSMTIVGPATGNSITLRANQSGLISVSAIDPTCGPIPIVLAERSLSISPAVNTNLQISATGACLGTLTDPRVRISNPEQNVSYRVISPNFSPTPWQTAAAGSSELSIVIAQNLMLVGKNPIRVELQAPGCALTMLDKRDTIFINPGINTALTILGDSVCRDDTSYVTIVNSQPGVFYSMQAYYFHPQFGFLGMVNNGESKTGTGSNLRLRLLPSWISIVGREIRYKVTATLDGCAAATMVQEPLLIYTPTIDANLSLQGSNACNAGLASIRVMNSQKFIRYQAFLASNNTILGTSEFGNDGALTLSFDASLLPANAAAQIRVRAIYPQNTCSPSSVVLNNTATVNTSSTYTPDLTLGLSGTSSCRQDSSKVTVSNSQIGVSYVVLRAGVEVSNPKLGTGQNLVITLNTILPEGINPVRVRAEVVGCNNAALMNQTPNVTVFHKPSLVGIVGSRTICSGQPLALRVGVSTSNPQDGNGFQNWGTRQILAVEGNVTGLQTGTLNLCCGPTPNNPNITDVLVGNGRVRLGLLFRNNITNCTGDTTSLWISVVGQPDPIRFLDSVVSVCPNQTALYRINQSPNQTYTWSYSGNGATITGTDFNKSIAFAANATSGILTIVTSNSCNTPNRTKSMAITVNGAAPVLSVIALQGSSVCEGVSGRVSLATTEAGVSYQAYIGAVAVSTPISGNGMAQSIVIPAQNLQIGLNTVRVQAGSLLCGGILLAGSAEVWVNAGGGDLFLTWTGDVDSLWQNPSNWSCGTVPTLETVVTIPTTPSGNRMPVVGGQTAICKDITLESGSALIMRNSGLLTINGNFYNNGNFVRGNATVSFAGSIRQSIHGNIVFNNLIIQNPNDVGLADAVEVIAENVNIQSGRLAIGNVNLRVNNTLQRANPTTFVLTDGVASSGGFLLRPVGASVVEFPVGVSDFTPAFITNTGTSQFFRIRSFNGVYQWGTSGNLLTAPIWLTHTWEISPQGNGAVANIRLVWNGQNEPSGFLRTQAQVMKNVGGIGQPWIPLASSIATTNAPYSISANGISTFSKFTVQGLVIQQPLPLRLLSFSGKYEKGNNYLNWSIAQNNLLDRIIVEKSKEGRFFSGIASIVASQKQSDSYGFQEKYESNGYYRLKLIDKNGISSFSNPVYISQSTNDELHFSLFPNPGHYFQISAEAGFDTKAIVVVNLTDMVGKPVTKLQGTLEQINNSLKDVNNGLAAGSYTVRVQHLDYAQSILWIKIR